MRSASGMVSAIRPSSPRRKRSPPAMGSSSTSSPTSTCVFLAARLSPRISTFAIPVTYVPARNTIFLSFALAWAEVLGASDIFIGVNALDYSGYPDCRPEFIAAFEKMARLATRAGVEGGVAPVTIRTPLIDLSKKEIIELGLRLGVDYSLTTSCYDPAPDGAACGRCDACQLRLKGFEEAGATDPVRYVAAQRG